MSFVFNQGKQYGPTGLLALDLWAMLVTVAPDKDDDTVSVFAANEYNGTNYARVQLTGEAKAVDDTNDRYTFDCDSIVFGAAGLGAGSAAATGVVIFSKVTTDADSVPIFYIDTGGFPVQGADEPVTVTFPTVVGYVQDAA